MGKKKKTIEVKLVLGRNTINLMLQIIAPYIETIEDVGDCKELIWRYLLLELHRKLMETTIEVEDEYDFVLRHYQALAFWELINRVDVTDYDWDEYYMYLYGRLYSSLIVKLNLPHLNLPTLD